MDRSPIQCLLKIKQACCFSAFLFLQFYVFASPGNAAGTCSNTINGISTINVYASSNGSEQSTVAGGFTFTRTNDLSRQVTVPLLLSGTALNGVDYIQVPKSIQFAVGESEKTLSIKTINDTAIEGNETVTIVLSLGIGYILGNHISDTISITDNDTGSAKAQLNPSQLNIIQQGNNQSKVHKLTISSATHADLLLGQLASNDFQITNDGCSNTTIKAGGSCVIDVVFKQNKPAQHLGLLTIPHGNSNKRSILNLNAFGRIISIREDGVKIDENPGALSFTGGGLSCGIDKIQWLDTTKSTSAPNPPDGAKYIPGFDSVDYKVRACRGGTTLSFKLSYLKSIPANAKLMQFGPTTDDKTDHWFEIETSVISGKQVTYKMTDGQTGDHDLTVNGSIINPIALLIPKRVLVAAPAAPTPKAQAIRPIPVFNPVGMLMLMISLAGLARRSLSCNQSASSKK